MTIPQSVDDYVWSLDLTMRIGALETRRKETTAVCSICTERVILHEDRVEQLTSSGTTSKWVTRKAETHRRECFLEKQAALAAAPDIDLWAS